MSPYRRILIGAGLACLGAAAFPVTFSGNDGTRFATVDFNIVGGNLQVILTNTAASDVLDPTEVLTAVFFNITGDPTLSRISGVLSPGSFVTNGGGTDPGGVVGGEWAYKSGLSQYSANQGISSAGLGIFGPADVFPGSNLWGPADPDGLQYGLTSAGDNPLTGNSAVMVPLIQNSVTLTLGAVPLGFNLSDISHVTFQYGTILTDASFGGGGGPQGGPVPGPAAFIPFAAGVACALRRKRRHVRA